MDSEILNLASIISENTQKVSKYLSENNLQQPSLGVDGPLKSSVPLHAAEVESARITAIDAARQLQCTLLGPLEYLMGFAVRGTYWTLCSDIISLNNIKNNELVSLHAISRFNIAEAFAVGEEASFGQIGATIGLNESDTRRLLRHALVRDIFVEPRPGFIAHNAVSRLLAEDERMREWVAAMTDDLWPAATQVVNALAKYPGSDEPNQTGFSLAHQTNDSMFESFSKSPERAKRFSKAMSLYGQNPGYDLRHIVHGYRWSEIGNGTIVDLGGAHGETCEALAKAYPDLLFIVQDLRLAVGSAPTLEKGLSERIKFMAHDFLTEQPIKDADVYLFRQTLHDWGDKYCIKILQNLIPALKPGARIIVNDFVLPEPGKLPRLKDRQIRTMDITMTQLFNAKERELTEWRAIFEEADERFAFIGGKQPTGSILWIIEVVWKP